MFAPFAHAAHATGRAQAALVDVWTDAGIAVAMSEVQGPRIYDFGELPVPMMSVTLYGVARHVLMVNGRVRRDGKVLPGRFRLAQPGQHVVVDAVPSPQITSRSKQLLLLYFDPSRLIRGDDTFDASRLELRDQPWDIEDPIVHLLARRLVEAGATGGPSRSVLAEQLGLTLGLHLVDRYAVRERPMVSAVQGRGLPKAALARVMDYLRAAPCLRVTLTELAGVAGYSPSYFLRLFRDTTGQTPHQYLQGVRIERAKEMLTRSALPIAEIALTCGYASQSHFAGAFRALTGLTPQQYRATTRAG